ncbi:MAG TPA: polysaccharide deacetylase family protein [Roseiarcus sp.]|nr:polysaccharide deacetylase family protein [Roseiarcus sp.]
MTRYAEGRRVVVIHEDDVGMTHGANVAFKELSAMGTCSAGSVMAPCPWFPEAIEMALANSALDIGVHLTLNSEKKPYRWRPLTAPPKSAGLTDEAGYFWPDVPSVRKNAAPAAVEAELRAQIDTVLATGIDVTHLDAHMGAAMMPEFVDIYYRLGKDYNLPLLLVKDLDRFNPMSYAGAAKPENYNAVVAKARSAGEPIFDLVIESPWRRKSDAETAYRRMFEEIPEGLTYLSLHFNAPGDFEVVEPDQANIRTEEYAAFKSGLIGELIAAHSLEVIGMRQVRDRLRSFRSGH